MDAPDKKPSEFITLESQQKKKEKKKGKDHSEHTPYFPPSRLKSIT